MAGPVVSGPPRKGFIDHIITPVTFVFFAINILFFILGITALALGGVALFDKDSLEAFTKLDDTGALTDIKVSGYIKQLSMAFMICGALLLIIGFIGCFGVAIGNSCFIYLYAIIFALMVVAQVAAFGYLYLYRERIVVQVKERLEKGVANYKGDGKSKNEIAMDFIQKELMCCGVNGGKDYMESPWYSGSLRGSGENVPVTCCKMKDKANNVPSDSLCQTNKISADNAHTDKGCLDAVKTYIFTRGITAIIISVIIMMLQLMGICYAVVIEKSFSDDDLAAKIISARGP